MSELKSRPLFDIAIDVIAPQELGATPLGSRRIVPVTGGTFEGDRLRGSVLPTAAADWIIVRNNGSVLLDVRLTLQTDDDALIFMTYRGIRNATPEVTKRLASGEAVDPSEYYFRTTPVLETGSDKYEWLNNIICVAVGERQAATVKYRVYEIL